MSDTTSALRIVWIYPDLLSTYGDQGNLLFLTRRAQLREIRTQITRVRSGDPVPTQGDIYLLGGGEDRSQVLAAERLRADGGLRRAVGRGAVVLAVCAGYQIIGESYVGKHGAVRAGMGLVDAHSHQGASRAVGEIVADVQPPLGVTRMTGFENHQGRTVIGGDAVPLGRVVVGVGNGERTEGVRQGRVVGTYLHGPVLPRNPELADSLMHWQVGELPPLAASWSERLHAERLAAVV